MTYQGMRWLKCDLHLHTPEGSDWNDPNLRLGNPRLDRSTENREAAIQQTARRYLRRCHEVGLDVIAVTDHNFSDRSDPREWFITHLVDQNKAVAAELGRESLVIFPGFEIDIGYHLICLFEPVTKSKKLQDVTRLLAELGLAEGSRWQNGRLSALRNENAYVPLRTVLDKVQMKENGIVIAAHAFSTDGICNDARHADDFRQNEDLLCVEVRDYPLEGRAEAILRTPVDAWRRKSRQPAFIMASDAKSLAAANNTGNNTIGSRCSWIKMSRPSIEGLRQAFLDHESRIRLELESVALDSPHGRIISLDVRNARFLADQTLHLSPELTCLIGGRGSGKSSIIEYLRILTRNDQGIDEASEAGKQLSRIRATLGNDSTLRMAWESNDGLRDTFEWKTNPPFQPETTITSRSVQDPATVFRNLGVSVYSQRQISELTDNRGAGKLLGLIDRMAGTELARLRDQEEQLKGQIRQLFLARRNQEQMEAKRKAVEQEIVELTRQWEARVAMQEPAREHRLAQDGKRHITRVLAAPEEVKRELESIIEGLPDRFPALPGSAAQWKHAEFFLRLDAAMQATVTRMQDALRQASETFSHELNVATNDDPAWNELLVYLGAADETFAAACREKGLNPTEVEQLREVEIQRRGKQAELEGIKAELTALQRQADALPSLFVRLTQLWEEQTNRRRDVLDTVQIGMARVKGGKPFVEFTLVSQADTTDFLAKWERLAPDRRSRLGREWIHIGERLHAQARHANEASWVFIAVKLKAMDSLSLGSGLEDLKPNLADHLLRQRREDWEELLLQRVADELDFTLCRQDGSIAGSLKGGGLSDGQRNTVVLSLLLSKGEGPVIVDQPEDELDSDFIFHELVPVVRKVKLHRQVIFATHNANLPVNGDAELVYALKADDGRGTVRAQGGLDREEVKDAVLDIMEGSEAAFHRRREKYHF